MNDIMKSIYDMMGKCTLPCMMDSAPREHVESFFQVPSRKLSFLPSLSLLSAYQNDL